MALLCGETNQEARIFLDGEGRKAEPAAWAIVSPRVGRTQPTDARQRCTGTTRRVRTRQASDGQ